MNENTIKFLLNIDKVLADYRWLMNSYVLDFYLENHWEKLSTKWSECLNKLNVNDIPWLLGETNPNRSSKCLLPLTLICIRTISKMVREIRSQTYDEKLFYSSMISQEFKVKHEFSENVTNGLNHIFLRGIKAKKRHEIQQLCKLIAIMMNRFDNNLDIIDFGSGKCHLSRILSICHGYKVFCIEAKNDNLNGAIERDQRLIKALKKSKNFDDSDGILDTMPIKVNRFLTEQNRIDELFGGKIKRSHLLLGLHACGSLSNLVLKEFVNNPNSQCLVLACCCYMNTEISQFPMSKLLKKNSKFILTSSARELACHAIEKFLNDFNSKELESLKIHGYRACLEVLLEKYAPHKRYQSMKNVKLTTDLTFKQYVLKAINGIDVEIPESIFECDMIIDYLKQCDNVILFYSLRLLLAPLIELYILMDYEIYLSEHNDDDNGNNSKVKSIHLIPLFSPLISPRNFILIANK